MSILLDRPLKIERTEVRPHSIGENQLRVSALPEKEIAEPLLAAGADENIDGSGFTEQFLETLARDVFARGPLICKIRWRRQSRRAPSNRSPAADAADGIAAVAAFRRVDGLAQRIRQPVAASDNRHA